MKKLIRNILLTSLLILSGFSSFVYANDTSYLDRPARPVEAVEYLAPNEFTINDWNSGFDFTVNDKTVVVMRGNKIVSIKSNNSTNQYYFDEEFVISQDKVQLSDSQYKLIVDGIENSKSRKIRTALVRSISQTGRNRIVFNNENLTSYMTTLNAGTNVRIINSVLDGAFKVLTPDGREGFMDTRTVTFVNDSLPPNIRQLNFDKSYIILVSQNNQTMKAYMKDGAGGYKLVRQSRTSTGKPDTPTPNGLFTIKSQKGYSFSTNSYGGKAYHHVAFRENHLFHSMLYDSGKRLNQTAAKRLGYKDSAGCIRLPIDDAKWLHDYVSVGSLVIIDNVERDINKIVANKNL